MESTLILCGDEELIKELHVFLNDDGIDAKMETKSDLRSLNGGIGAFLTFGVFSIIGCVIGQKKGEEKSDKPALHVSGAILSLAKAIIKLLDSKKVGHFCLTAGEKSIKITKKDSDGSTVTFLEEHKGTKIEIKFEI